MKSTLQTMRRLGISKIDDNYSAEYFGYTLRLKRLHAQTMVNECDLWEKIYLPIEIRNRAVLDIGSGCGETMAFFFAHGASKVVGIETDPEACMFARTNIWENRWKAIVINEPFALRHLSIPHDLLKVNAEGAEQILLAHDKELGPCAVKVHKFGSFDLPRLFQYRFRNLALVSEDKSRSIVLNGYGNVDSIRKYYDKEVSLQRESSTQETDCTQCSNE